MATTTISDTELSHLLSRLSTKSSVQSVLILSRSTGSIIRSTGSIARDEAAATQYAGVVYRHIKACEELVGGLEGVDEGGEAGAGLGGEGGGKEGAAGGNGDDLRLVRIRTRRRELVVVPDAKYILVVFHDTPTAN